MRKKGLLGILLVFLFINIFAYSSTVAAAPEASVGEFTIVSDPIPPIHIPGGEPIKVVPDTGVRPTTWTPLTGSVTTGSLKPVPATGVLPQLGNLVKNYGQYGIAVELVTLFLLVLLLRRGRRKDA